ncbi:MAG: prephenate dehydratase domain-containing protein [bacterium]|nr:prephenate dehydratase domain-containing protein [bacterium]
MHKLFEGYERIVTLGPEGTFSNQAATLVGGDRIRRIDYTVTLPQIVKEVVADPKALGVLPIENSSSGIVGPAQDSLVESEVVIIAELQIAVSYALVSQVPLEEIESFYCHAVAFDQIMTFTANHLSQAQVIYADSNMNAAQQFAAEPQGSKRAAVIPKVVANQDERFEGLILAEQIEDYQNNSTRFAVVKRIPVPYQPDFKRKKTSLVVETHEDRHSLLFELLREFHVFSINLCRLESRPSKAHAWQYRFFIDFYNNHRTAACLEALSGAGIHYKLLGTYSSLT